MQRIVPYRLTDGFSVEEISIFHNDRADKIVFRAPDDGLNLHVAVVGGGRRFLATRRKCFTPPPAGLPCARASAVTKSDPARLTGALGKPTDAGAILLFTLLASIYAFLTAMLQLPSVGRLMITGVCRRTGVGVPSNSAVLVFPHAS